MKNFSEFLNEVFEFNRRSMDMDPHTNIIHYYKGEDKFKYKNEPKVIPFTEIVMHTPLEGMPKNKNNLWTHIMRYPTGYGDVSGPHLQVHFDVSHVTDHDYLDIKREHEQMGLDTSPPELYANAFARTKNININDAEGGNAYSGLSRIPGSGMSFLFKKIAPHIVKNVWHISKLHPKLPIAFSAGSDVPGHAQKKFMLYNKIVDSLQKSKLVEPDDNYVPNKYAYQGLIPWFRVIKPIHR